ncbi:MAG: conjugal transfer protein TraD [Steroidobacteraceae bacterium]
MQQLGELVIATGADAFSAEELAGALIVLAETRDAGKREACAKCGAAFFQRRSRRPAKASDREAGGAPAQPGGALLWMAGKLQSDQGEQARALWTAKGKQAFEND